MPEFTGAPISSSQALAQAGPDARVLERFDTLEQAKGNEAMALAVVQGPVLVPIYRPGMPVRMVSALDPTALKPGEFSLLQNLRPDSDLLVARFPTTLFGQTATTFSPSASATFAARGIWSGNLNGTQYIVGAWYDGTAVRLYSSTDGHSFTEVTSTSSAYGLSGAGTTTRFPDSGQNCAFQSITNVSPAGVSTDYLVIQNGSTVPMLYSATAVHGANVFPIQAITAPNVYLTTTPTLGSPGFLDLTTLGAPSNTNGFTSSGGSGGTQADFFFGVGSPVSIALQFDAGTAANMTAAISTSGPTQYFVGTSQLCLVADYQPSFDSTLVTLRFEVYDYTSSLWVTVYNPDPANPVGSPPIEVPLGIQLNAQATAVFAYNNESLVGLHIGGLRFIAPATVVSPASNTDAIIFAMYAGGAIAAPAGSGLAVSYSNSATLTESAGVVLPPATLTPTLQSVGVASGYGNANLPIDPNLYYNISVPAIASSQFASGVDTLNLYVSLPGSDVYGYSQSAAIASYSGSWSASSTALSSVTDSPVDTYVAPDAYACAMPQGTCMAGGGGRSFVGTGSQYWFSEYGLPFRYRLALDVSNGVARSSSGGFVTLPNTEKCVQFAVAGASALGTNNLFLFTSDSTYNVQGPDGLSLSQPTLLASIGCSAPGSVALYRDSIFFLDDQLQITKFAYGQSQFYFYQNVNSYQLLQPISKRVVDDQTRSIPSGRIQNVQAVATYDRLYLSYTLPSSVTLGGASGTNTTNSFMLVFDMTIGSFISDIPGISGMSAEAMCANPLGLRNQVYCQSSDKQCYVWENSSAATTVNVALTSGAMNPNGSERTFFGRIKLVMDSQPGGSMSWTKYLIAGGLPYGSVLTDTSATDLSMGVTGPQVYRYDCKVLPDSTNGPAGMSGLSCQIGGICAMTPGTRIFSIENEQMAAAPGADSL